MERLIIFSSIILDCDGVLADSEVLGLDASVQFLHDHRIAWSREDIINELMGFRDDVIEEKLHHAFRISNREDPPDDFLDRLYDLRRQHADDLNEVPGARDFLSTLNIPKAVASSSRRLSLHKKLKKLDLWSSVAPHVYSAEEVERGKPSPDIFLHAAAQIGALPIGCLVIEDSVSGIRAARAANMTVWGFVGGAHCYQGYDRILLNAGAEWVAPDFEALRKKLSMQN